MGEVVLVCSGKGGVGKTTFAVNLSIAAAGSGLRVLLMDLNMGRRNIDIYLGMEDRILFDLGDVISGMCSLDRAIIDYDLCPGLSILACPQYREIDGIGPGHLRALYEKLKGIYDLVVVDCPVSLGGILRTVANGADAALIITIQDYSSVRNADALNEKLETIGIGRRFYAINRMDKQYSGISMIPGLGFITKALQIPLIGIVSEEPAIHMANNAGCPVALEAGSDMQQRFAQIVSRIMQQ